MMLTAIALVKYCLNCTQLVFIVFVRLAKNIYMYKCSKNDPTHTCTNVHENLLQLVFTVLRNLCSKSIIFVFVEKLKDHRLHI